MLLVLSCVALAAGCAASPSDAELVYCLSGVHRSELVESANTLARYDRTAPVVLDARDAAAVDDWRVQNPERFAAACSAIVPKAPGGDEMQAWLLGVLNVVLGALLATATSLLTLGVTRRRQVVDALDDETGRLYAVVEELAAAPSEARAPDPRRRVDQVESVRRAAQRARTSASAQAGAAVGSALDELAATLREPVPDRSGRDEWHSRLWAGFRRVQDGCAGLCRPRGLRTRLRPWWTRRTPVVAPSAAGGGTEVSGTGGPG